MLSCVDRGHVLSLLLFRFALLPRGDDIAHPRRYVNFAPNRFRTVTAITLWPFERWARALVRMHYFGWGGLRQPERRNMPLYGAGGSKHRQSLARILPRVKPIFIRVLVTQIRMAHQSSRDDEALHYFWLGWT